jgi:hypothetical protein
MVVGNEIGRSDDNGVATMARIKDAVGDSDTKACIIGILQRLDFAKLQDTLVALMEKEVLILNSAVFGMPKGPGVPPSIFVEEGRRHAAAHPQDQKEAEGESEVQEIFVTSEQDCKCNCEIGARGDAAKGRVNLRCQCQVTAGSSAAGTNEGLFSKRRKRIIEVLDGDDCSEQLGRQRGAVTNKKKQRKPAARAPPPDVEIICLDDSD